MSNENKRIVDCIDVDRKTVQKIFSIVNPKAQVECLQLIPEGSSTTNYIVSLRCSSKKYVLRIYPENGGNAPLEISSYKYAKQYVNVPEIHLFDDSREVYNRPYFIMDYLDASRLDKYVINNKAFPEKIALDIGCKLALLHSREYESMALLNSKLEIQKVLLPVETLHEYYLNSTPGKHISIDTKNDVLQFISDNRALISKLNSKFVYSHGDFSIGNILIDNNDNVWLIDFEYSLSAPIYYDIGRFFRDNDNMNSFRTKSIYDAFSCGYNSSGRHQLSEDWIKLARLMDMTSLLHLLNYESAVKHWATDIEEEIRHTMRVLRDYDLY